MKADFDIDPVLFDPWPCACTDETDIATDSSNGKQVLKVRCVRERRIVPLKSGGVSNATSGPK